jgi:hypothetical protein
VRQSEGYAVCSATSGPSTSARQSWGRNAARNLTGDRRRG